MLYFVDGNYKIITSYTVTGHKYTQEPDDIIHLTLNTDKGDISFELCSDSNTTSSTALNALIQSANNNIEFSLYSERKYIFIGSVDSVSETTLESTQICKATGCMI